MDHQGELTLRCFDDAEARALAGALGVEAGQDLPKATSRVEARGDAVWIAIDARDAASLRAAVNSYLRWARVALEAARAGRPRDPQTQPGSH